MDVVTLNVWGHHGDWPRRRDVLASGFRALAPDLVALQETVVTGHADQAREILGEGFSIVHAQRRAPEGMGVSIASRWPFVEVQELRLEGSPRDDGFPCTTLIATIEVPGVREPVHFVNHFPSWQPQQELERERQAGQAARRLGGMSRP